MRRSELRVHGTARRDSGVLLHRYRNITLDREPLARAAVSPSASTATAKHRHASGAETAALDQQSTHRPVRPDGDELDDAAQRVRAVQITAAAAVHLDPIDRRLRHLVPEDPSAERVVERESVGKHK